MAELPASMRKRRKRGAGWALSLLSAGGGLLLYSLLRMGDGGIPGWEPAGERLEAAMKASAAASAPTAEVPAAASSASPDQAPPASSAATVPDPKSAAAGLLDLNKATESELDALPGIGPSKAKAIVAYRESRQGGFRTAEELLQVKGIGPKIYGELREKVTVTAVPKAAP